MSAVSRPHLIRWETWTLSEEADRRFRRIVTVVGVPVLALAILITLWKLAEPPPTELQFNGQQFVRLLAAAPVVAPPEEPKPAAKAPEKPKAEVKPKPKPEVKTEAKPKVEKPRPTAREVAQKAMAQFTDELSDLRDQSLSQVTAQNALTSAVTSKGGLGGAPSAAAIAASAAAFGGAVTGNGSVTASESGTGLGNRRTGAVRSTIPSGRHAESFGTTGPAGRTASEIQAVFERNQAPFYAIYNRESRQNASINRGKIVVRLVIAPSGAVQSCTMLSSTFGAPEFERKIIERIRLLNFGAKNVPVFTIDYPINFIPQ